jgi:hypothetical protein
MVKEKRQMMADNDNMLYSVVIVLTPTREAAVRATMEYWVHTCGLGVSSDGPALGTGDLVANGRQGLKPLLIR